MTYSIIGSDYAANIRMVFIKRKYRLWLKPTKLVLRVHLRP